MEQGKVIWYEGATQDKEINVIDCKGVHLLYPDASWGSSLYYNFLNPDQPDNKGESYYDAQVNWEWTGKEPIHNVKYVLNPSKRYSGADNPDNDFEEMKEWANGENHYPTACQQYNICRVVPLSGNDYQVECWDDNAPGWQICTNLGSMAHDRCLPCIGQGAGNLDNLNHSWNWNSKRTYIIVGTGGVALRQYNSDDGSYTDTGGLSANDYYQLFYYPNEYINCYINSVSHTHMKLDIRICIPWGCFCGGKRSIGLGIDYIYTS